MLQTHVCWHPSSRITCRLPFAPQPNANFGMHPDFPRPGAGILPQAIEIIDFPIEFSFNFHFFPNSLPEGVFRGPKCRRNLKSAILGPPLGPAGAQMAPQITKTTQKANAAVDFWTFLEPTGAPEAARSAPGLNLSAILVASGWISAHFCQIWPWILDNRDGPPHSQCTNSWGRRCYGLWPHSIIICKKQKTEINK